MKFFSSLLGFILIAIALQAQVRVTPANKSLSTNGIFYSLPKTVVNVEVTIEKESFYAGPLASYADEYLGLGSVGTSDNNTYRITEIKVSKEEIPDSDQFYFIEFTPDDMKEKHQFGMMLSENGLLTGFNHQVSVSDKGKNKTVVSFGDEKEDRNKLFDYQDISGMQQVIDTVIRTITVDTATIEEFQVSKNWVRKTREEKARQAAERIQKILQDRYYLSIGYQEVAYEKGTIEYMDNRLKERQNEYEALFTGKTITSKQSYQFEFIPEKRRNQRKKYYSVFPLNQVFAMQKAPLAGRFTLQCLMTRSLPLLKAKQTNCFRPPKSKKGFITAFPDMQLFPLTPTENLCSASVCASTNSELLALRQFRVRWALSCIPQAAVSKKWIWNSRIKTSFPTDIQA